MREYRTQDEIIARKVEIDAAIQALADEKRELARIEDEMVRREVASRPPSPLGVQRVSL